MEQNKSVVKLVVCDLDGTLIGPGDYGIEMAKHTLDFCRQKGSRVTIATGRSFGATKRYMTYLKINEPVISNGGAFIAKFGEPPIYEKTIDKDMSKSIALDLMNTIEHPFYFLVGKDMYTHVKGQETKRYSQLLGYHINIVDFLEDIPGEPTQIVLRVPIVEADEIQSYLNSKWSPNVTILKSMPHLLEIQPPDVSKAKALEFLAELMMIDKEQVLTIGDELNDLDMLMWSGMKAAVGNAHDKVKRNVCYVSHKQYSEGVRDIVQRFLGDDLLNR